MTTPGIIGDIGGFYDENNVLVGSAVGFISPVGTPDPADSITVFDPAIWTAPWKSAGATEQGWQVNWNPQTQDVNIDEQPTPVDQQMTTASLQFVANLSEDTVQSWGFALNADATVVAPGASAFGKTTLVPNGSLKRYKVVLESQNFNDMPRRYIVPKMTCAANVGATFRRAAGQRLIPVTFTSICKLTDIQIVEITANKTS
jgi:hypothetical protein